MDKYEYQLKLDQINKLIERNDYATALKIADNIDWKRVRSVNTLSKVADIYEKNEKYEESRDLLMMAYERAPVGRMIAYRLADLCIRLEDYDQAIEYYKDFVHSAPKDPAKLILKYKIFRGKGAALKDQISILEEYRSQEYEEEWSLELAYLYEEAGEIEKCVNECDELILWFNDGKYVLKAMELKMRYEPLTPAQQEKYELRMKKTKLVDTREEENPFGVYAQGQQSETEGYQQDFIQGYQDPYGNPYPEGYDPSYGQAYPGGEAYGTYQGSPYEQEAAGVYGETPFYGEQGDLPLIQDPETLGDGSYQIESDGQMVLQMPEYHPVDRQITGQMTIQEILSEWEKARQPLQNTVGENTEEVELSEDTEEERTTEQPVEEKGSEQEEMKADSGEEMEDSSEEEMETAPEEEVGIGAEDALPEIGMPEGLEDIASESDQISENTPEIREVEEEKSEAASEDAPEICEAEEESETVSEDAQETHELEEEEPEAVPEEEIEIGIEDELPEIGMPEELGDVVSELDQMPENVPEIHEAEENGAEEALEDIPEIREAEENGAEEASEDTPEIREAEEEEEPETAPEEEVGIGAEDILPEIGMPEGLEGIPAETEEPCDNEEAEPEAELSEEDLLEEYEESDDYPEEQDEDDDAADDLESRIVKSLSSDSLVLADADDGRLDGRIGDERIRRVQRRSEGRERGNRRELTEDQKKLFTYFAPVRGMSDQLWMALENEKGCIRGGTSNIGNIMVMGEPGTGKTMLAVNLVKAIQKSRHENAGKLAKISADTLNEKDVSAIIRKLNGGALIIERASELTNETAIRLEVAMCGQTGELLFIFEDDKQALRRFMKLHPKLAAMCTTKIDIPIFNNDELVEFGKSYAYELEYSIDEMAVLALYNRIGNMQRDDYDVSVTDVKKIVDAAIEKNERGGVGKVLSLLTKKRYDEDDCIVLREKDFEE